MSLGDNVHINANKAPRGLEEEKVSIIPTSSSSSGHFAHLPSQWLSYCFTFIDLRALLHVGCVSRHWRSVQQHKQSWLSPLSDWESSRCFQPMNLRHLQHPPLPFKRMLSNIHISVEELMDEAGGLMDDGDSICDSLLILELLGNTYTNLVSLSLVDEHQLMPTEECIAYFTKTPQKLQALSVDRQASVALTQAILSIPSSVTSGDSVMAMMMPSPVSELKELHMLNTTVERAVLAPFFQSAAASDVEKVEVNPVAIQSWSLSRSLITLEISIDHPAALLVLTQLQQLTELDLAAEFDSSKWVDVNIWRCLSEKRLSFLSSDAHSHYEPSHWCDNLRKFHCSVFKITDDLILAISTLTQMTDLALLQNGDESEEEEPFEMPDMHRCDWSQILNEVLNDTSTRSSHLDLTPAALYELRHLHSLVKMELNFSQAWLLAIVPFLAATAVRSASGLEANLTPDIPLAFWSHFPRLFQLKYHSPFGSDVPSLTSIDQLNGAIWQQVLDDLLPTDEHILHEQDLILYALGACPSLRSLHLDQGNCTEEGMRLFADSAVLSRIAANRIQAITTTNNSSTNPSGESASLLPLFDLCLFSQPQSDRIAMQVSRFGVSLRYLHFIRCASLHDDGLLTLLQSCRDLHTLDIRACQALTPKSLSEIGLCIPGLHSLNVSFISCVDNDLITQILVKTPSLHSLHMEGTNTTDALLAVIVKYVALLCLNVRMNSSESWSEEALAEYSTSRPFPIQIISDYEESGEK